jgi:hypothetical protein
VHENAKRGDSRLPATVANRHGYAESGINRPPPDFNGKEGVDGSSPSEGFAKSLQAASLSRPCSGFLTACARRRGIVPNESGFYEPVGAALAVESRRGEDLRVAGGRNLFSIRRARHDEDQQLHDGRDSSSEPST